MSLFRHIKNAWTGLRARVEQFWSWHQNQMENNGRYARTFVQGLVRALWQQTLRRFALAVAEALLDLYMILRQDGLNLDEDGFPA